MHNAKFDWHMLGTSGVDIQCRIHCTMAMHRLVDNRLFRYGLKYLAPIVGAQKYDHVEKYISKHKLYVEKEIPGKKKKHRRSFYAQVPIEVMQP